MQAQAPRVGDFLALEALPDGLAERVGGLVGRTHRHQARIQHALAGEAETGVGPLLRHGAGQDLPQDPAGALTGGPFAVQRQFAGKDRLETGFAGVEVL